LIQRKIRKDNKPETNTPYDFKNKNGHKRERDMFLGTEEVTKHEKM